MKKSGSSEAQLYKHSHWVIHYSIIFLPKVGERQKVCLGLYASFCEITCSYSQ